MKRKPEAFLSTCDKARKGPIYPSTNQYHWKHIRQISFHHVCHHTGVWNKREENQMQALTVCEHGGCDYYLLQSIINLPVVSKEIVKDMHFTCHRIFRNNLSLDFLEKPSFRIIEIMFPHGKWLHEKQHCFHQHNSRIMAVLNTMLLDCDKTVSRCVVSSIVLVTCLGMYFPFSLSIRLLINTWL